VYTKGEQVLLKFLGYNSKDRKCNISADCMARECNLSSRHVRRLIKSLIKKRCIKKKSSHSGKKQANVYYLSRFLLLSSNSVTQKLELFKTCDLVKFFGTHYKYISEVFKYLKSKECIKIKYLEFFLIYIFMKIKKTKYLTLQKNRLYACERLIRRYRENKFDFWIKLYPTLRKFKINFKKEGYTIPEKLIDLLKKIKEKVKEKGLERKLKPKTFRKGYNKEKNEVRDSQRQEIMDAFNTPFKKEYKRKSIIGNSAKSNKMLANLIKVHREEIDLVKASFIYFIEEWNDVKDMYGLREQYPEFDIFVRIKNQFLTYFKNLDPEDEEGTGF
jgi:hypothetical protein